MRLVRHNPFQIHWFVNHLFDFSIIVQKNHIQIVSCVGPLKVWFLVPLSVSFLFLVCFDVYTIYILLFTFIYSCFSMNNLETRLYGKYHNQTALLGENLEAGFMCNWQISYAHECWFGFLKWTLTHVYSCVSFDPLFPFLPADNKCVVCFYSFPGTFRGRFESSMYLISFLKRLHPPDFWGLWLVWSNRKQIRSWTLTYPPRFYPSYSCVILSNFSG